MAAGTPPLPGRFREGGDRCPSGREDHGSEPTAAPGGSGIGRERRKSLPQDPELNQTSVAGTVSRQGRALTLQDARRPQCRACLRARAIHDRVITLDTHVDIDPTNFTAKRNCATGLSGQVDLPKMESGGLDAVFLTVYAGQNADMTATGFARANASAIEKFQAIHRLTDSLAPVRHPAITAELCSSRPIARGGMRRPPRWHCCRGRSDTPQQYPLPGRFPVGPTG